MPMPTEALEERKSLRLELNQRIRLRYLAKLNSMVALGVLLTAAQIGAGEGSDLPKPLTPYAILQFAPLAAAVFCGCWLHHVLRIHRISSFLRAQERFWPDSDLAYEHFVGEESRSRWIPGVGSAALMFGVPSWISSELADCYRSPLWWLGNAVIVALIVTAIVKKRQTASKVDLALDSLRQCRHQVSVDGDGV